MKIPCTFFISFTIMTSAAFTAIADDISAPTKEQQSAEQKSRAVLRFVECAENTDTAVETAPMKESGAPVGLTGPDICDENSVEKAETAFDPYGRPAVFINFTPEGGAAFAEATKRLVRKKIAVIFRGKVISCPVVMAEITGGKIQITGAMTVPEAKEIAEAINAAKSGKK